MTSRIRGRHLRDIWILSGIRQCKNQRTLGGDIQGGQHLHVPPGPRRAVHILQFWVRHEPQISHQHPEHASDIHPTLTLAPLRKLNPAPTGALLTQPPYFTNPPSKQPYYNDPVQRDEFYGLVQVNRTLLYPAHIVDMTASHLDYAVTYLCRDVLMSRPIPARACQMKPLTSLYVRFTHLFRSDWL